MSSVVGSISSPSLNGSHVMPPADSISGANKTYYAQPGESEQEIARLTWLVLDGAASPADRRRLAELVSAQHSRRHAHEQ